MAHKTSKSYFDLQKRLDKAAQGAPASKALYKILEILFTKKEAELASVLPLALFTKEEAAKRWKKSLKETNKALNRLADKGILLDFKKGNSRGFLLAPTMAGFFEFSLMRTHGMFDKKKLSKLFFQYINSEEEFVRSLFIQNPSIGRAFVNEQAIPPKTEVLDYERASKIIDTSSCITVGVCYCRHKMEHMGKACDNPQKVCLTFNKCAESLSDHKIADKISKKKAHKILDKCRSLGLIQFGDNVQDQVNFICNCCSCCCEAIQAYKRFGYRDGLSTTNFYSNNTVKNCKKCGTCVKRCPVDAIKMTKQGAKVDKGICVGCGVCTRFCPSGSLKLKKKDKRMFVPKDMFERIALEAIDTGKLQNYLFDNENLLTHSILRKFLAVLIRLPPQKQILANKQLKSRFIKGLTKTKQYKLFNKLFNDGKEVDYSHSELR